MRSFALLPLNVSCFKISLIIKPEIRQFLLTFKGRLNVLSANKLVMLKRRNANLDIAESHRLLNLANSHSGSAVVVVFFFLTAGK